MWNKIRGSRGFYMFLAILAAVVCWLYVDIAQHPTANVTISNIPVTFIGTDTLEENDLLILDESPTISIVVSGPRSVITKLNQNNITILASAADIDAAGVYSLKCEITLPSAIISASTSAVSISSRSASAVDVTVVQMVTKTVPIRAEFTGTVAENRVYDEDSFVLQQKELEIRGEESVVNAVSYAKVVLSETNLTDTWSGWLDVILCDQDGQTLQPDNLSLEASSISVSFFVECTKEVALTVTLSAGGGATSENAVCTVTPASITVSGPETVLEDLNEINVGTVDLSQVVTTGEYTYAITLPSGVSSLDGVSTATVQVSISGLETRRITTTNIQLVNAPDGHRYSYDGLEVRVRGKSDDFSVLMSSDIQVTLDFTDVEVADGTTVTIPAQVEIVGISDLGILGSYSVEVAIEPEAAAEPETGETADSVIAGS